VKLIFLIKRKKQIEVLADKALRRILGPKVTKVTGHWRKLLNKNINNFYFIAMILSGEMRWARHVACIGYVRIRYIKTNKKSKLRGLSPQANIYRQSDRRMSAKLVSTFADRGCRMVSATDPHGRILGFLDRSRYHFFQVAPHLYSRG
jgi:hypothetical protein